MRDRDDEYIGLPRGIWWAVAGLIVFFIAGSIVSFYVVRAKARRVVASQEGNLSAGVLDLQNFDFADAAREFGSVASTSSEFQSAAGMFSLLTHGKNVVGSFSDLTAKLTMLASAAPALEHDGFSMVTGNGTSTLLPDIESLRNTLTAIDSDTQNLSSAFSFTSSAFPAGTNLFSLQTKLHSAEDFLNAFLPWLANPAPHHVLVLLENPAELRPTGGFLGSYADIAIASGTITSVSVHDIADVDSGFLPKIAPPQPLQLEVSDWRPSNANWFFDYPTSASETISFFEQSPLYNASGTTFDGAIAVSSDVIGDLLSVTGPVTVASTTFTADNFLIQIQKIVQANLALMTAKAKRPKSAIYPKEIIGDLSHAILSRLASSTGQEQEDLSGMAENWIADKDVMVYFKNPIFENLATTFGAAGDVYDPPHNFEGDYFALTDTNINGQKSDLYVSEDVNWQSQINDDGTVSDHLSLVRTHTGNTSPYWWYDAPNQSYIQLFTMDGSTLTNAAGGVVRTIPAPVDYATLGYSTDPLVAAIQSSTQSILGIPAVTTHEESGKEVFAVWSRVSPGSSSTLSFDYTHRLFLPVAAGTVYQFVFDKQPGTNRHYTFEIDAPLGYIFAETNIASWTLDTSDIPGRLVQDLTLEKL